MRTEIRNLKSLEDALSGEPLEVARDLLRKHPRLFSSSALVLFQDNNVEAFVHPLVGALTFSGIRLINPLPRFGENRSKLETLRITQAGASISTESLYLLKITLETLTASGEIYKSYSKPACQSKQKPLARPAFSA